MSSLWSSSTSSSLNVCRVHVILDLSNGLTTQSLWVNSVVKSLKEGYRDNDSVYLALLLRQTPVSLCRWFKCSSSFRSPGSTPLTPTRANNTLPIPLTWDQLLHSLNDREEEEGEKSGEELLAIATDALHALLDCPPWEPDDFVLTDVHILVSELPSISSLSLSAFTGVCWRVIHWLRGSVHVTCLDPADSSIAEWCESIPASFNFSSTFPSTVCSLLWRGDLLISEHKTSRQAHSAAVCSGLGLSLYPDCPPFSDNVLTGTGLKIDHAHLPTHLEVVQVIDMAALPHFYISPLRCSLFLDAGYQHSFTRFIFQELFHGGCGRAVLLRLCYGGAREDDAPLAHHRKTDEWIRQIVENEFNPNSPSLSHSLLPATGPLILVPCTDQSDSTDDRWSCDGWFLWQPEHMMSAVQVAKLLQKHHLEEEEKEEGSSVCDILSGLPVVGSGSRSVLLEEQAGTLADSSSHQNELIPSPSSWFEMKALHSFEWIQRKMIKRLTTKELMFGEEIAPPPPTIMTTPTANDLLKCFTEQGSPTAPSALSPLGLKLGGDSSFPKSMITPDSPLPYHKVINSTPTTSRKYHGVIYCLSEEDSTRDARLSKIQRRYLSSERTCNCSTYETPPRSNRHRKPNRKEKSESKQDVIAKTNSSTASSSDNDGAPLASVTGNFEPASQLSSKPQEDLCMRTKQDEHAGARRGMKMRRGGRGKARTLISSLDRRKNSGGKIRDTENIAVTEDSERTEEKAGIDEKTNGSLREKKSSRQGSSDEKSTRKHMLEKVVVQCLKEHKMSRHHMSFRKCYTRLFNLSKVFVQDLKFSADLTDEMRKIVDPNTDQVIQFELKQSGVSL